MKMLNIISPQVFQAYGLTEIIEKTLNLKADLQEIIFFDISLNTKERKRSCHIREQRGKKGYIGLSYSLVMVAMVFNRNVTHK